MKKIDLAFIIISLFVSGLCYLTALNMLYAVLIFILFLLDYFIFLRKSFNEYYSLKERVHICYHFINSFVITLSVKESLDDAYLNATRIKGKRFHELSNGISDKPVVEKIKYLRDYFDLSIYKMFLNVFELYEDQGGNILQMSDNLIRECTRTEKALTETTSISFKHLVEYIVLWSMSLGILVFMRFSISDFYTSMLANKTVGLMIFIFYLLALVSLHLFINTFTNLTIKRDISVCKN